MDWDFHKWFFFTHQVHNLTDKNPENGCDDCLSAVFAGENSISLLETFGIRHSGLDPESRISFWIPAFAGIKNLINANIYATFRFVRWASHIWILNHAWILSMTFLAGHGDPGKRS